MRSVMQLLISVIDENNFELIFNEYYSTNIIHDRFVIIYV